MALKGCKGKKVHLDIIFPRHFIQTAKAAGFDTDSMVGIMAEMADTLDFVIMKLSAELRDDFPAHVRDSILDGLKGEG
ncbi:hypothetical protein ACE02B_11410 [Shewanella mangrovisoli]|uniref:hypothetical protein n=1 Tax=Shewanella mangrovisoli TaxID=2864211 RepID=UPI0035BAA09B